MSKIIIDGGRRFKDYVLLCETMDRYLLEITQVVSGLAKGADTLGIKWANQHDLPVADFPADWYRYGQAAGRRRNIEMADYADQLVAFWDGRSNGTGHMIRVMKSRNKPVQVVSYEDKEKDDDNRPKRQYTGL